MIIIYEFGLQELRSKENSINKLGDSTTVGQCSCALRTMVAASRTQEKQCFFQVDLLKMI